MLSLLNLKKIVDIKPCFEKIFKERKPKYIWSDQESSFFSKEMLDFLKTIMKNLLYLFKAKSCFY